MRGFALDEMIIYFVRFFSMILVIVTVYFFFSQAYGITLETRDVRADALPMRILESGAISDALGNPTRISLSRFTSSSLDERFVWESAIDTAITAPVTARLTLRSHDGSFDERTIHLYEEAFSFYSRSIIETSASAAISRSTVAVSVVTKDGVVPGTLEFEVIAI